MISADGVKRLRGEKRPAALYQYQKARQIKWEDFFAEGNTFAVSGNVSDSAISHSKYAALRLKDAVADYFKEKTGQRPDVSVRNPDILLNLHIRNDKAVISLDTSGGALTFFPPKNGLPHNSVDFAPKLLQYLPCCLCNIRVHSDA